MDRAVSKEPPFGMWDLRSMSPADLHIAGAALRAERPEPRQLIAAFRRGRSRSG